MLGKMFEHKGRKQQKHFVIFTIHRTLLGRWTKTEGKVWTAQKGWKRGEWHIYFVLKKNLGEKEHLEELCTDIKTSNGRWGGRMVTDFICSEKRAVAVSYGTSEGAQFIKPLHDNHLLQHNPVACIWSHNIRHVTQPRHTFVLLNILESMECTTTTSSLLLPQLHGRISKLLEFGSYRE